MALLSNRRRGLLGQGPEAVRQAAADRRASYMAQPQRPSAIGTPGRPIFVDNPINSAFEGLGSLGKMLGEYGDWKKAEAEKQKREDAIKAAYGDIPTQRTVTTPEALVYKGRGGVGDVIDGGSLMPPQGAKIAPHDLSNITRDQFARSQGLEKAAPELGRTYRPQSTETVEGTRKRDAYERAQYFASQGLYDLATKEIAMGEVQTKLANRTKDIATRKRISEAIAANDYNAAMAAALELQDGAAVQQALINKVVNGGKQPKAIAGGRFMQMPDGSIVPNQNVIDALQEEAAIKADAAAARKPPTQDESKAKGFAERMQLAEFELEQIDGFNPADFGSGYWNNLAPNFWLSPDGQRYKQAAENWISANLRKESGAVIGVEEMEQEFRKYFPQPGDGPDVIAQKARARAVALQGMISAAGRFYEEPQRPPQKPKVSVTGVED